MYVEAIAEALAPRDAPGQLRTIVLRRLDGEPSLLTALADARIGWQADVLVDLGDTPMVSAAVLASLRRLGSTLRERGGELTVRSSHAGLVRLLELTLLTLSFHVERTTPASRLG